MARPSKVKTVIPVVPLIVAGAAAVGRAVAAGARHGSKIKRGGKTTTSNMMAKDAVKRGQLPKKFSPTNSPKMKPVPVKTKLTKPSVRTLGRASKTAKAKARQGAEGPKRSTPVKKNDGLAIYYPPRVVKKGSVSSARGSTSAKNDGLVIYYPPRPVNKGSVPSARGGTHSTGSKKSAFFKGNILGASGSVAASTPPKRRTQVKKK